ncbi:unnamed protein product [Ceratitis capitata]|uniref:(Mediterranean fruit fly) hypothetical protein n=1 Tax=Ceratitis capitata TaxID=7213 RepID=A0A811UE55_CERCA|nr:unnamed protein product [Ceratitis capitata]
MDGLGIGADGGSGIGTGEIGGKADVEVDRKFGVGAGEICGKTDANGDGDVGANVTSSAINIAAVFKKASPIK